MQGRGCACPRGRRRDHYGHTYDFLDELLSLTEGRGVDLAFDSVGAATFASSLKALARGGMVVSCVENLDAYFRDCVIGGPGAVMIPIRERAQFGRAIRTKIIREIAGAEASVIPPRSIR
jgi:NADPH:quinone reductase-like Zn-dependent oxidoreductase